jgi:hypothetical protein
MKNKSKSIINNQRGGVALFFIISLAIVFLFATFLSFRGWGYSGYYGWNSGPSWFYWGGPKYYHSPSIRTGSVGGPSHRGGGAGGGK